MTTKADFDFYYFSSTNGWKIFVAFEEFGIKSVNKHYIDIVKGEQFTSEFIKLNPNSKVPVIVDNTVEPPFVVIESGAILVYLAEKYGKFLPDQKIQPRERSDVFQWLSWQISTHGPMLGQLSFFGFYCDVKMPIAIKRYQDEAERIYKVLDARLSNRKYIAGDDTDITIADMAVYGWGLYLKFGHQIKDWDTKYPHFKKWLELVETRPSFQLAWDLAAEDMKKRMEKIEADQKLKEKQQQLEQEQQKQQQQQQQQA
ncbi:hypothetical protein RB653_003979 [Dictyostelium firmibasis]|uniref:Glutathione S-transferase n=1 Tax=Dictyostelium firmibasis TaxID=79012 RepID=A0AAN7YXK9_9MYCE